MNEWRPHDRDVIYGLLVVSLMLHLLAFWLIR